MAEKNSKTTFDPHRLTVRDNVPEGCRVSLAGMPRLASFAWVFRDELAEAGLWQAPTGVTGDAQLD